MRKILFAALAMLLILGIGPPAEAEEIPKGDIRLRSVVGHFDFIQVGPTHLSSPARGDDWLILGAHVTTVKFWRIRTLGVGAMFAIAPTGTHTTHNPDIGPEVDVQNTLVITFPTSFRLYMGAADGSLHPTTNNRGVMEVHFNVLPYVDVQTGHWSFGYGFSMAF